MGATTDTMDLLSLVEDFESIRLRTDPSKVLALTRAEAEIGGTCWDAQPEAAVLFFYLDSHRWYYHEQVNSGAILSETVRIYLVDETGVSVQVNGQPRVRVTGAELRLFDAATRNYLNHVSEAMGYARSSNPAETDQTERP